MIDFVAADGEPWWELKSLFLQECVRRGLLFTGAHNMALCHGEREVSMACRVYGDVFALVAEAVRTGDVTSRLEGPPVEPVFRKP